MPSRFLRTAPIGERLAALHRQVRVEYPAVERVAVALYDSGDGKLHTFAHSTLGETPLAHYEMRLDELPGLADLAASRTSRVIEDLRRWPDRDREHTRRLLGKGYRSSLTSPLYDGEELLGFLFYDAAEPRYFAPPTVRRLGVHTQLAAAAVSAVLERVRVLRAAVRATRRLGRLRDPETGAHLERMARYTRIIARALAPRYGLDDEEVALLALFAPLHDVGKIGVPDRVLLKRGPLNAEEFRVMRSHVDNGGAVIDMLVDEFDAAALPEVEMLRNLVVHHHEAADGSGYPAGLAGDAIPLEARIVRVADVFDALTTARPYKPAWTDDEAFEFLQVRAQEKFDAECVAALASQRGEVVEIRRAFAAAGGGLDTHEGYAADI